MLVAFVVFPQAESFLELKKMKATTKGFFHKWNRSIVSLIE